jgi:hypothetical protein
MNVFGYLNWWLKFLNNDQIFRVMITSACGSMVEIEPLLIETIENFGHLNFFGCLVLMTKKLGTQKFLIAKLI